MKRREREKEEKEMNRENKEKKQSRNKAKWESWLWDKHSSIERESALTKDARNRNAMHCIDSWHAELPKKI